VILRAAALIAAARALKGRMPVPRLAQTFDARPRARRFDPARTIRIVDALLRRTPRQGPGHCMERSLTLLHLFRRAGYPTALHFGVRREGEGITGHAWLSLHGAPLAEPTDPHAAYAVTYTYDPAPPTDAPAAPAERG